MAIRRFVVSATTNGSGDAEAFSPPIYGKIVSIRYVKTDFADGVDFVITGDVSGETIWSEENVNASASRYPRAATHSTAGVASLYAALGEAVLDKIAMSAEAVKIVVSSGGDTKTGTFHITVDG
jgi:hypothetical protein